jgi:formylglycine-generating enzyme required for sulfatase activity
VIRLLTLLTLLALPADAAAARPRTAHVWWAGLAPPAAHAEARGVVALRPPAEGRVRVVGGTFRMGSTTFDLRRALSLCQREVRSNLCDEDFITRPLRAELVQHDVTVFTFDLDRTEVTVRAYRRCVEAGVCPPPGFTPGDPRFDRSELPVTSVRWEDAVLFCNWSGGRLPTEAEWEYAARGTEGREFPWGDFYNSHLCNHGSFAPDETDATDGFVGLAPVGSFPDGATRLGILDMAGNASEWVADLWDVDDNGFGYAPGAVVNPKGPQNGVGHVLRGGSFADGAAWVRTAARGRMLDLRAPVTGFRCAYEQ